MGKLVLRPECGIVVLWDAVTGRLYHFDGGGVAAPAEVEEWRVLCEDVPSLADWQREPGRYRTYNAAARVQVASVDGRLIADYLTGDKIIRLWSVPADWAGRGATARVSYLNAYNDLNLAKDAACRAAAGVGAEYAG